ncbi:SDR family NAD(P)-dependent oxidoreductase [Bdellovibrionota bacterium FG-2]
MKKRVLITGASRGIGRAIAERFAKGEGAEGVELITPARADLDLSNVDSVKAYIKSGAAGAIDVLVNVAGINKINSIDKITLEDWQETLTTNLTSVFVLTQALAPSMVAKKWGRIVNISSLYGVLSRPGRAAYSASKSGLNGFTRAAALEYGPYGVLVNSVCPGFVETELTRKNNTEAQLKELASQTALKRMAQPQEIAELVAFLCSEKNTYLTGQSLLIDGGFSCQ